MSASSTNPAPRVVKVLVPPPYPKKKDYNAAFLSMSSSFGPAGTGGNCPRLPFQDITKNEPKSNSKK